MLKSAFLGFANTTKRLQSVCSREYIYLKLPHLRYFFEFASEYFGYCYVSIHTIVEMTF